MPHPFNHRYLVREQGFHHPFWFQEPKLLQVGSTHHPHERFGNAFATPHSSARITDSPQVQQMAKGVTSSTNPPIMRSITITIIITIIVSYHIISYHIVSYHIISYHIISCQHIACFPGGFGTSNLRTRFFRNDGRRSGGLQNARAEVGGWGF